MIMFVSSGYNLHQAGRSKSAAELRAEDARLGELAAAVSASWATLTSALGTLLRQRPSLQTHRLHGLRPETGGPSPKECR
jgi:hypothetical protein